MKKKKSLWPLAIVLSLAIFATFIVSVAVYISGKEVNLTRKNYYTESMDYDRIMAMKRASQVLEERPSIGYNSQLKVIEVLFPQGTGATISGNIEFIKPDNAELDFEQKIELKDKSKFVINAQDLKTGIWEARLYWSIDSKEYLIESTVNLL